MKFDTMVLGTYHMDNSPNLFTQYDDVTTDPRQREITEVVDYLIPFRPTKIAVERLQQDQGIVDRDYQRYRSGDWALPPRECYQLGFRLADRLQHPRVYAIDYKNEVGTGIGGVYEYAQEHVPEVYEFITTTGEAFNRALQHRINTQTVREVLYWLNESRAGQVSQPVYMAMLRVADHADRMGLDWVAGWYVRNLTIYANLLQWTEPGDRWLVIYGDGHAPLLRQFLHDTGEVTVIPAADYLSAGMERKEG